ncbi:hypothetical protein [Streptomyces virginiae]|uniref:hypothetical protein n=1 Tax=Streptomyces virginiae TaxID=1961 RepID=UPI0033187A4E
MGQIQRSAAKQARARAGGAKTAAVRCRFISRTDAGALSPPLARLLRGSGGRGGAARLNLYLSMLWLSRNEDKPVFQYPAVAWAQLLGYRDPEGAGARRVQEALRWLDNEAFVRLQRKPGVSSAVHLLSDSGAGRPYTAPGPMMKRIERSKREEHLYVQLPAGLWTNGWITELSGAAIAMYLVLLNEQRGEEKPVWISPSMGRDRYDLSDETRRKGLNELAGHQLVSVAKRPLHQGLFEDTYRSRNVYDLKPRHLDDLDPARPRPATSDDPFAWDDDE